MSKTRIAVIGAGLGGTAAAALLQGSGYDVKLYEQARGFSRLDEGIHLGPNVMKVMRRIGCEDALNAMGSRPDFWFSRHWKTAEPTAGIPLGAHALEAYGANYLTVHRADLHALITSIVAPHTIIFGKRLHALEETDYDVRMLFTDGTEETADLVIGADGLKSKVREHLLDEEPPRYTGYVEHRAVLPASLLGYKSYDACVKWWSNDRYMLAYYVNGKRSEYFYVTGVPEREWPAGVSMMGSSREEMKEAFIGFHADVQHLIDISPSVTKRPLFERDGTPLWSFGRLALLGDACRFLSPHRGHAAAMGIEDAAMLTRCLDETGIGDYANAFALYEANRSARTTKAQCASRNGIGLSSDDDPSWAYDYDVFNVPFMMSGTERFSTVSAEFRQ
ncbi:FAD-dependent monooxygenase [Paraburkholderia caffeinilytica]|uniref:FAD-dependent monooxygenase n=1 Tax=Paraburkholderia caffeinilytica TaxID=1761016 RepID=UPI0038BC501B